METKIESVTWHSLSSITYIDSWSKEQKLRNSVDFTAFFRPAKTMVGATSPCSVFLSEQTYTCKTARQSCLSHTSEFSIRPVPLSDLDRFGDEWITFRLHHRCAAVSWPVWMPISGQIRVNMPHVSGSIRLFLVFTLEIFFNRRAELDLCLIMRNVKVVLERLNYDDAYILCTNINRDKHKNSNVFCILWMCMRPMMRHFANMWQYICTLCLPWYDNNSFGR